MEPFPKPASVEVPQEEWDQSPLSMQAVVVKLLDIVREQAARLNQNSTNSSKPPSTDPPGVTRKPKEPSGKPRGGQPGHVGRRRELRPSEECEVKDVYPDQCRDCRGSLTDENNDASLHPDRQQSGELPEVRIIFTEYRLHGRRCKCGAVTKAKLPADAPTGCIGPRLQAELALLSGRYRLTRREVQDYARTAWDLPLSLGQIHRNEQCVSDAIKPAYDEAHAAVTDAAVRNADETGWREGSKKAWLWTATSSNATVFLIHRNRSGKAASQLLGAMTEGYLGSDRWKAYTIVPMKRRQICHSHLDRDFQKMVDSRGKAVPIGTKGLEIEDAVFKVWHEFKDKNIDRAGLRAGIAPLRLQMHDLLETGLTCSDGRFEGMCRDLLQHEDAFWTFVEVEGVEPTNNSAERTVRKGVLWRKGSFGTQSPEGSRFAERMLTLGATCRQNGRNLLAFLVDTVSAAMFGKPPPRLLGG